MPSWCHTQMLVRGPSERVAAFRRFVRGYDDTGAPTELSFAVGDFMAVPDEVADGDDALVVGVWRQENWGTSGQATDVHIEEFADGVRYTFATPYSPPHVWMSRIAQVFRDLEFALATVNLDEESAALMYVAGDANQSLLTPAVAGAPDWGARTRVFLAHMGAEDLVPADFDED